MVEVAGMVPSGTGDDIFRTLIAVKGANTNEQDFTLYIAPTKKVKQVAAAGNEFFLVKVAATKAGVSFMFSKYVHASLEVSDSISAEGLAAFVDAAQEACTSENKDAAFCLPVLPFGWVPEAGIIGSIQTPPRTPMISPGTTPPPPPAPPATSILEPVPPAGSTLEDTMALLSAPDTSMVIDTPLMPGNTVMNETNMRVLLTNTANQTSCILVAKLGSFAKQIEKPAPNLDGITNAAASLCTMAVTVSNQTSFRSLVYKLSDMFSTAFLMATQMTEVDCQQLVHDFEVTKSTTVDVGFDMESFNLVEYNTQLMKLFKTSMDALIVEYGKAIALKVNLSKLRDTTVGTKRKLDGTTDFSDRICNYYVNGVCTRQQAGFSCTYKHDADKGFKRVFVPPNKQANYQVVASKQLCKKQLSVYQDPQTSLKPWHRDIKIHQSILDRVKAAPDMLKQAFTLLETYNTPSEGEGMTEELLLKELSEICLPTEHYCPGGPSLFIDSWKLFVERTEPNDPLVQEVFGWMDHGYKLPFVTQMDRAVNPNPNMKVNSKKLVGILETNHYSQQQIADLLERDYPKEGVFLNNLHSANQQKKFVNEEIEKLLKLGTVGIWAQKTPPAHIFPIGVDEKDDGKLRLICALLYTNYFEAYDKVVYEDLHNVKTFVLGGDWLSKEDAKSGYHNVPVHPDFWKWLCFKWQGRVYYFKYLPFGDSSAPLAYTKFMRVVNKPLRLHGEECNQYLDDRLAAARKHGILMFRTKVKQMFNAPLGIFVSTSKCIWTPTQHLDYLGLDLITNLPSVDEKDKLVAGFGAPEVKRLKVKRKATELLSSSQVTRRQLASFAGTVVALNEAIPVATLYLRDLYFAMKECEDWDGYTTLDDVTRWQLEWWIQHIDDFTGYTWIRQMRYDGLCLVVDSSASRHAGQVFDLLTGEQMDEVVEFPPQQMVEQLQRNSTLNETRGVAVIVALLLQRYPGLLQHKMLHVKCDNEGTINNFNGMKAGSREMFEYVASTWKLLIQYDVQVEFTWVPREENAIQKVDDLSKVEDITDVVLSKPAFNYITKLPLNNPQAAFELKRANWGVPTLDVFANNLNAKADNFFSRWSCSGTLGTNAYGQRWNRSQDTLVWCFVGPFTDASLVIKKIREEECDTILILPARSRESWISSVFQLPVLSTQFLSYHDKRGSVLYQAGPSFPPDKVLSRMNLVALFISWKASYALPRLIYKNETSFKVVYE